MDLGEFLLARIAEDEAVAQAAAARNGATWSTDELPDGTRITGTTEYGNPRSYRGDGELWDDEGAMGMFAETAEHVVRHDPARVRAECEAKRRIVGEHRTVSMNWHTCAVCDYLGYDSYGEGDRWGCDTLRLLALPYASHPDFRPEWSALADA